ncbi:hypothetical protein JQ627_08035 [Bradyrhizobium liaoningense]|nr:hypothetical protein [Bradyrhizobium liaoningense]
MAGMKKPLAITRQRPKAGFENGFGMKFGQPRFVYSNGNRRLLLLKMKQRNRRVHHLPSIVAAQQR